MKTLVEGQGVQPTLVVERFIAIWPGETCSARFSSAPLENTYWKLTRLGGKPVAVAPKQREPYFVLDNKSKRIAGFGGCNRFTGTYQQNSDRLAFGKMAMTFMACSEGMETERDSPPHWSKSGRGKFWENILNFTTVAADFWRVSRPARSNELEKQEKHQAAELAGPTRFVDVI